MAYDYQNAIRQLQEAHRLLAGGLFGRIAQKLQRKRDIRAREHSWPNCLRIPLYHRR